VTPLDAFSSSRSAKLGTASHGHKAA
jgi:hypothetical protein